MSMPPVKHYQGDVNVSPSDATTDQQMAERRMGPYASEEIAALLETRAQPIPDPTGNLLDTLHAINDSLEAIRLYLAKEMAQPEEDEFLTLNTVERVLRRKGRRHLLIWTPVAIDGVIFNVQGLSYTCMLSPGWNVISLPDGTTITGASDTSQVILVRVTNWQYGSAI